MLIKSRDRGGVSKFEALGSKMAYIVLEIGRRVMRPGGPSNHRNCFTGNRERDGLRWQGGRKRRQGINGENYWRGINRE